MYKVLKPVSVDTLVEPGDSFEIVYKTIKPIILNI